MAYLAPTSKSRTMIFLKKLFLYFKKSIKLENHNIFLVKKNNLKRCLVKIYPQHIGLLVFF